MNKFLFSIFCCFLFVNLVISLDKGKDCKCKIKTSSRIIGGREAFETDYPWQVSISNYYQPKYGRKLIPKETKIKTHTCGGVILNEKYVLTAAHCTQKSNMYVGFGGNNDLVKIFDDGRIPVKRVIVHPNYQDGSKLHIKNDIALLELDEPIKFNGTALPACLNSEKNKDYGYENIIATGWGLTSAFIIDGLTKRPVKLGELSRFLKEVEYKDISKNEKVCEEDPGYLCTNSAIELKESVCKGDSGGPLHKTQIGNTTIIGLTSYSDQTFIIDNKFIKFCNGKTYFTRVSFYLDWIESFIGQNHC